MKLLTINQFLNLFFLALVVDREEDGIRLYLSTIFQVGVVKAWWHIRLFFGVHE